LGFSIEIDFILNYYRKKAEKNETSNKNITLKIPDENDIQENLANLKLKSNLKPNSDNKSNLHLNYSSNSVSSAESSIRNSISIDNSISFIFNKFSFQKVHVKKANQAAYKNFISRSFISKKNQI